MEQLALIKRIAAILQDLEIPYVITGGIAISVWGRTRFTADVDVAIELLPHKLHALARQLAKIGKDVYVDQNMMSRALERKGEFNVIDPDSDLKIDFWVLTDDPFDKEELSRSVQRKIEGQNVRFISPEDLILRKLLWYQQNPSDKQLEDISSVLKRQKRLNWRYLQKWAKRHTTAKILTGLKRKAKEV